MCEGALPTSNCFHPRIEACQTSPYCYVEANRVAYHYIPSLVGQTVVGAHLADIGYGGQLVVLHARLACTLRGGCD